MKKLLILILCFTAYVSYARYHPDAGLITPYSDHADITVSGPGDGDISNIIDENPQTFWQTPNPFPGNFLWRADQNVLIDQLGTFMFSSAENPENIHDGSSSGNTLIDTINGKGWVQVSLSDTGTPLVYIAMRGIVQEGDSVEIYAFRAENDSVKVGTYHEDDNYSNKGFALDGHYTAIKLYSNKSFNIHELGALTRLPREYIVMDLGEALPVRHIKTRHFSGDNGSVLTRLLLSRDSTNWIAADTIDHEASGMVRSITHEPDSVRYVKLEYVIDIADYQKASVREVTVLGPGGEYGNIPEVHQPDHSLAEGLGINGIWGWATDAHSNLQDSSRGPLLYSRIAAAGRNYHNWDDWDVSHPDTVPDYEAMVNGEGTDGQDWLNWNTEYEAWQGAGLEVQTSIQYGSDWLDTNATDIYQAAYNYGYAFADHFGPGHHDLVTTLEIGNEPWHQPDSNYIKVLHGMAKGVKDADEALKVAPAAFQAYNDNTDVEGAYKNYMGYKIDSAALPYLDILNIHAYSFTTNEQGIRVASYPEDPACAFNQINNAVRWRNANMPGKPIYLTEWGWDIDSPGEPCNHDVCVSEKAGANYAIRGYLKAIRSGVDKAFWFFFRNTDGGSSLFSRSGLTNTGARASEKKRVFYALQQFVSLVGDKYFLGIEQENDNAWIYKLGDKNGTVTHLAGWRPIPAGNESNIEVTLNHKNYGIEAVYSLDGSSAEPADEGSFPRDSSGNIVLTLHSTPKIMKLNRTPAPVKKNIEKAGFSIYPNPFSETITIDIPHQATYKVFKLSGKCIDKGKLKAGKQKTGADWPEGTYMLTISNDKFSETVKIMKK